jgi:magnesium-transporting ATPase (P-type)
MALIHMTKRHLASLWLALPAVVVALAEWAATFFFQPAAYWTGVFEARNEISPLGYRLLGIRPLVFSTFMAIYILIIIALVLFLKSPWNKVVALVAIVGHTEGIYGWLKDRSYWYAMPVFFLVGLMTILCWQKTE